MTIIPVTLLHALLASHLRGDDADPGWPDRDRLVAGHPDPALPPAFTQIVGGPPGLAFGAATGMAIAERMLAARFGRSLIDHRTWLLADSRDLAAGTAQEAVLVASALALSRLAVLVALPQHDPRLAARYTAAGWTVRTLQAGDEPAADAALAAATRSQKPTLLVELGNADHSPFAVAGSEGASAKRSASARRAWLKRLRRHASREPFLHSQAGTLPPGWHKAAHPPETITPGPAPAMDAAVHGAVSRLAAIVPDLTGLPSWDGPSLPAPPAANRTRPLAWDGLDLAAAACSLGLALHGGMIPQCWVPAGRSSAIHPAFLEAARLGVRLVFILSASESESAAVAEIGHPDASVFQPGTAAEVTDCLVLAIRHVTGPSLLVVSQAATPVLPASAPPLCARGGYLVCAPPNRTVTLAAAGAAMARAAAVHRLLALQKIQAGLVSIPNRRLFDTQDDAYRAFVLGTAPILAFGTPPLAAALDIQSQAGGIIEPDRIAARIQRLLSRKLNREAS